MAVGSEQAYTSLVSYIQRLKQKQFSLSSPSTTTKKNKQKTNKQTNKITNKQTNKGARVFRRIKIGLHLTPGAQMISPPHLPQKTTTTTTTKHTKTEGGVSQMPPPPTLAGQNNLLAGTNAPCRRSGVDYYYFCPIRSQS